MDTRNSLLLKADSAQRYLFNNFLSSHLPLYIVTEYPKSGGTWIAQILGHYLNIPFPRNRFLPLSSCVVHCHQLYTPLMRNVVCVIRDGRDVVVSAYFYMLFHNEKNSPLIVKRTRQALQFTDYDDIEKNLSQFIEYLFIREPRRFLHFSWCEFLDSWENRAGCCFVRYEDMLNGAAEAMKSIVEQLTKEEANMERLRLAEEIFSFNRQKENSPNHSAGQNFLRKGVSGDWKNYFNRDSMEIFDQLAGDHLVRWGYEKDRQWLY